MQKPIVIKELTLVSKLGCNLYSNKTLDKYVAAIATLQPLILVSAIYCAVYIFY